jgi:hypothetical protein
LRAAKHAVPSGATNKSSVDPSIPHDPNHLLIIESDSAAIG